MSDKNMIALAEIRNGYALNKYGNLTLEQNSLIKYDNLCLNLIKEIQELKKQLEELDKKLFFTKNELDIREKSINNHLNQQKEFIKWLEDYLNLFDYNDIQEQAFYDMLEEILQKYKEIIGNDINVGSKGGKDDNE